MTYQLYDEWIQASRQGSLWSLQQEGLEEEEVVVVELIGDTRPIWTSCTRSQLSPSFISASVSDPDKRLQALWVVCDKLPKNNKTNLRSVTRQPPQVYHSEAGNNESTAGPCYYAGTW